MTLDEILTQYEDLWRKAALENHGQLAVAVNALGPWGGCAWLNPEHQARADLLRAAEMCRVRWVGPSDIYVVGAEVDLHVAMIFTNNVGKWSWDMLANKFRDCVEPV